jgi:DNA-binding transcriptional LysR family regulator
MGNQKERKKRVFCRPIFSFFDSAHPAARFSRPPLRLARRGSFSAAAKELFRVPSTISYTVSKLEEDLGVRLFERFGPRVVLTPAGEELLKEGRYLLKAAGDLEHGVLIKKTVEEPRPPETLHLAWRTGEQGAALRWWLERLRQSPPLQRMLVPPWSK